MNREEVIEAAKEFYHRRSSSYSPRMDGGDRYELMADFAADIERDTVKRLAKELETMRNGMPGLNKTSLLGMSLAAYIEQLNAHLDDGKET